MCDIPSKLQLSLGRATTAAVNVTSSITWKQGHRELSPSVVLAARVIKAFIRRLMVGVLWRVMATALH